MPSQMMPMPNDEFDGGTVVASVYTGSDLRDALLLILNPTSPFFAVHDVALDRHGWYSESSEVFENIVPAVEKYQQSGGDY